MTALYLFALIVIAYWFIPWLYARGLRLLLRKGAKHGRTICLTFDDGPGNRLTPLILDKLREEGLKATFFVLGRNLRENGSMLRRIVLEGHVVASHGFDHLHAWKRSPWRVVDDIRGGWQALDDVLASKTKVYPYRPPYGKLNLVSLLYLLAKRASIIQWTIDSEDTKAPLGHSIRRLAQEIESGRGGVVLFHDFDRADQAVDEYVLRALDTAISEGRRLGLTFGTITPPEPTS